MNNVYEPAFFALRFGGDAVYLSSDMKFSTGAA